MQYVFEEKEFLECKKNVEIAYNLSHILRFFCKYQQEDESLYHLTPLAESLHKSADSVAAIFIEKEGELQA